MREWVNQGGALMMMVDHFPMPATAENCRRLSACDSTTATPWTRSAAGPLLYTRADKSLADHPITRGRSEKERVDSVATFTGSAFQIDGGDQY